MHEVQKREVRKAIAMLELVKDTIGFAVEFDGKTYGNRELKPAPKQKVKGAARNFRYPYGATRKHYLPYLKDAQVGDVAEIPFGTFEPSVLCSNIGAFCTHYFGKGNSKIFTNHNAKVIEVLIAGRGGKCNEPEQQELFNGDDGTEND